MRLALIAATATATAMAVAAAYLTARPSGFTVDRNPGAAVASQSGPQPADSTNPRAISGFALAAANALQLQQWVAPWNARLRRSSADRVAQFAVASAERLAYRLARADSLYAQVARGGPDALTRQSRLWRAFIVANAGHFVKADSLFRLIERDARIASDTLTALDAILAYSGTTARVLSANAGLVALAVGDSLNWKREPALDAAARCRASNNDSRLGNRERARRAAREGIAIATRAGLPRLVAACQFMLATEFARTGLTDSLRGPLTQAMEMQVRLDDMAGLAASKQWAGYYLANLGKIPEAKQSLAIAWNASKRAQTVNTSAWIAINHAALAQGFYDAAANTEWLMRADTLMHAVDDLQGLIELAKMQVTRAQRAGDYKTAERYLSEARTAAERLGEPSVKFSITSEAWELAMSRGDIAAAAASTVERRLLIDRYKLTGWDAEVTSDEAEILLRHGQGEKALPLLDRLVNMLHPSQRLYQYLIAQQRALAFSQQGNTRAAAKSAIEAAEEFDAWRASLNDRTLRTLSVQTQRQMGWTNSTLAAYLADHGETEVAFALAERRRARDLRDRLALAAALSSNPNASPDSTVQTVMTVSDIQRSLPDDQTALVMMDAGEDGVRGTAFVLTRDALTAHGIPSVNEVSPRIRRLVALLEAGRDATTESRALGTMLMVPILSRLESARITRIVFLPEGVLHRLPFDVLKLPDGRYVVERFETAVSPSATVLAKLANQPATSGVSRTLALADADVALGRRTDTTTNSRMFSSLFGSSALMPRLGGAREEVAAVRRLFPATVVRTGASASESGVKRNAASYNVLHFATHAVVDEWSGASAALALTSGAGEDGMFDSDEIARMHLTASLVVLSACRTVGGEVIAGEGVRGLTGAFLHAGARSVVATGWRVGDRDVVPVVSGLYEQLAQHRAVGAALRAAKLAAIRRNVAPSVWGAFTLVGDPWRVVASATP